MPEIQEIKKILIANRGEIAIRIMRTCEKMGIETVTVFSDADEGSLFVKLSEESMHLGGSQSSESYLNQEAIIQAALETGCDAIHPGYGFLAENAAFARLCQDNNIIFIGPSADAIEAMGSKMNAKRIMKDNDVPVIPGYNDDDQSDEKLIKEAKKVGYPLLLKASAGGGGKGMRIVRDEKNLKKGIEAARRESKNAFGDDTLLIEKYFESSRHIEFQIFGDKEGRAVHIFERECSVQRRHQKIIEESPSPAENEELREKMGLAAVNAARAISYDNAGTVEFILNEDGKFYFLEVNTRLQVEHPVTEMITGLDLVEWQIRIA